MTSSSASFSGFLERFTNLRTDESSSSSPLPIRPLSAFESLPFEVKTSIYHYLRINWTPQSSHPLLNLQRTSGTLRNSIYAFAVDEARKQPLPLPPQVVTSYTFPRPPPAIRSIPTFNPKYSIRSTPDKPYWDPAEALRLLIVGDTRHCAFCRGYARNTAKLYPDIKVCGECAPMYWPSLEEGRLKKWFDGSGVPFGVLKAMGERGEVRTGWDERGRRVYCSVGAERVLRGLVDEKRRVEEAERKEKEDSGEGSDMDCEYD